MRNMKIYLYDISIYVWDTCKHNYNICIYIYIQWYTYDVYIYISLSYLWNQTKTSLSKNVGEFSTHPWKTIIDPTPISSDDVLAAAVYKHLSSGQLAGERGWNTWRNQPGKPAHFLEEKHGSWWVFMSLYLFDDLRPFLKVGKNTLKFLGKMMDE